jgi:hypothetical protein
MSGLIREDHPALSVSTVVTAERAGPKVMNCESPSRPLQQLRLLGRERCCGTANSMPPILVAHSEDAGFLAASYLGPP